MKRSDIVNSVSLAKAGKSKIDHSDWPAVFRRVKENQNTGGGTDIEYDIALTLSLVNYLVSRVISLIYRLGTRKDSMENQTKPSE